MKKRVFSLCLCGVLTLSLAAAAAGAAQASERLQVLYNQVGISLFSEEKVSKGDSYIAPNGQAVPSVITYIDSKGGTTNYLSVRQISEILGIDVAWNSKTGNVDIEPRQETTADNIQIGVKTSPATVPKYGEKIGPFTEIDPAQVDTEKSPVIETATVRTISTAGTSGLEVPCYAEYESYVVYTVTNNGENPQLVRVRQKTPLGESHSFTSVLLPAGETLCRAFSIEDGAETLQSVLEFGTIGYLDPEAEVTVNYLESDVTEVVRTYP